MLVLFSLPILLHPSSLSEETYVFERTWAIRQQSWCFSCTALAVDGENNVYVGDSNLVKSAIKSLNGKLITQWNVAGCIYFKITENTVF